MSEQALEGLGLDTSEQLPDDDLDTETDAPDDEIDPSEDDEVDVTFGDESDDDAQDGEDETPVIKTLRKVNREQEKELRRLRRLEQAQQQAAPVVKELPPKPTLESCGWDETEFEQKLDEWKERSKAVESVKAEQDQIARTQWDEYQAQIKALNVKNYPELAAEVADVFDQTRQNILWDVAQNKAMLIYALGKKPAQLERLSKIQSLAKFAAELGKLEMELKVSKRSEKPAPIDTNLRNSAPASGNSKKLAQLEAEAMRTGDRTKLIAYKRNMRK